MGHQLAHDVRSVTLRHRRSVGLWLVRAIDAPQRLEPMRPFLMERSPQIEPTEYADDRARGTSSPLDLAFW